MKCLAILLLAAVVAGSGFNRGGHRFFNRGPSRGFNRGGHRFFNRGPNRGFNPAPPQPDFKSGNSEYIFSFLHDGHQKYEWQGARDYCLGLGHGYDLVNIETPQENSLITSIINYHKIHYIWTGGYRNPNEHRFHWTHGHPVRDVGAWSHTGGKGTRQPDNREGNEYGLAILNNVYEDGIRWHDVATHHRKPTICERNY